MVEVELAGLQLQNNKSRQGEEHSWISSHMTKYLSTPDNATYTLLLSDFTNN